MKIYKNIIFAAVTLTGAVMLASCRDGASGDAGATSVPDTTVAAETPHKVCNTVFERGVRDGRAMRGLKRGSREAEEAMLAVRAMWSRLNSQGLPNSANDYLAGVNAGLLAE